MDLNAKWHGIDTKYWIVGGTVVGIGGLILVKRWRAARAAGAVTTAPSADATGSALSSYGAPLPGYSGGGGGIGSLFGQYGPPAAVDATTADATVSQVYADPGSGALPAPVVQAAPSGNAPPPDAYAIGQVVNPSRWEKVVSSVFDPVFGWLNLTNIGGVYTGGGATKDIGSLPYGGSYLGYVDSLPADQRQNEMLAHSQFTGGTISLLPGGGYQLTNEEGQNYAFQ